MKVELSSRTDFGTCTFIKRQSSLPILPLSPGWTHTFPGVLAIFGEDQTSLRDAAG